MNGIEPQMDDGAEYATNGLLTVAGQWKPLLAEAGLDTFDSLMMDETELRSRVADCQCVSSHQRGQSFRLTLSGGKVLYLKRDRFTPFQHIAFQMIRLRIPQPMSICEMINCRRVQSLGLRTAPIVAFGQRRRMGLPHKAVLLTAPLEGIPLDEWLKGRTDAVARRKELRNTGAAVALLHGASLIWRDLVPRHIYISPGLPIGLLDVERMRPARIRGNWRHERHIKRFCKHLGRYGADEAEVSAFLEGLGAGRF